MWLEDRGLSVDLLANMGFTVGEISGGPAVKIPFVRDGEMYLAKYRPASSDKRFFCSPSGMQKSLWNVDALRRDEEKPIVITEGELDAVACIQSGWIRSVSIPDGWDTADQDLAHPGAKMTPLIEVEDTLRTKAPYVIVATDADQVGAAFLRTMVAFLEGCDVRTVTWPDGCKDANDVLRDHGEAVLNQCLHSARRVDPPGCSITGLDDLPALERRRILRTGQRTLDRFAAFEIGTLSISTGVPGSGKTTFATFLADQIRRNEGVRIGMACFETHPHGIREQISRIAGAPWEQQSPEGRRELSDWFRIVRRRDFERETEAHDMLWVRQMVRSLAVRDQCKFIIIDPWNEIDHTPSPGDSLTNYINMALTRLRQWAEQYDCHIHLIVHPKKMPTNEDGKPRMPTGYDCADSAAFYNKPALGYTVHLDDDEGQTVTKILTWKVRERELYDIAPGLTTLEFDPAKKVYRETARRAAA